jgi:hypothetical protein
MTARLSISDNADRLASSNLGLPPYRLSTQLVILPFQVFSPRMQ